MEKERSSIKVDLEAFDAAYTVESQAGSVACQERRDKRRRARTWKSPAPLSPTRMALIMAGCVFLLEFFCMFLLNILPPLSKQGEALLDSSILLFLLIPVYLFFYRPFWAEHHKFSREVSFLSRKLLRTVEEERKRVSHELHDQCGQTLTALQFGLETLRKGMPKDCGDSQDQVEDLTRIVKQLGNEIREVTHSLRPAMLEQIGLVAALRSLVREFSQMHPHIEIREVYDIGGASLGELDEETELALYRICQECLHNISKYANADKVIVRLEERGSHVVLNMGDHGRGFDPRSPVGPRKGFGLLGIRERVADLGGVFRLSTEIGKGTFITVTLPLEITGAYGEAD